MSTSPPSALVLIVDQAGRASCLHRASCWHVWRDRNPWPRRPVTGADPSWSACKICKPGCLSERSVIC